MHTHKHLHPYIHKGRTIYIYVGVVTIMFSNLELPLLIKKILECSSTDILYQNLTCQNKCNHALNMPHITCSTTLDKTV